MTTIINADTSNGLKLTSDTSGELELQSAGVTQAKITSSGLQNASGSAITSQAGENLTINGNMQIAQRGTSSTGITTTGFRTVDHFRTTLSSLGTWTEEQSTDAPDEFANSFKLTCTTADASPAAGDLAYIRYMFEGFELQNLAYGTSSAKPMTLSFWVKSNKTGSATVQLVQNDNSNKNISPSYTINTANTWEKKTISIPADVAGNIDNDNGPAVALNWWLNSGSTYSSGTTRTTWTAYNAADSNPANLGVGGATSDYFAITGVQLEVGTVATPFENLQYGQQLALCQRYYYKISGTNISYGAGFTNNSTNIRWHATFPVQMRTAPSSLETTGTASDYRILQASAVTSTSVPNFQAASETTFRGGATCSTASFSLNNGAILDSGGTAYLAWSAEL